LLREKLSIWENDQNMWEGYPRAGDRTKSAAEHDGIMQTGLKECVREKGKETGEATMKESGGHCTTVSARNEYQVLHCVVVLDSADIKRYTYATKGGS